MLNDEAAISEVVFFASFAALLALYFFLKGRRKRRLLKIGVCFDARVAGIEHDSNIAFTGLYIGFGSRGKHLPRPFRARVYYEDDSGNTVFEYSRLLYYVTASHTGARVLSKTVDTRKLTAKAWVSPKNPDDKHMQIFEMNSTANKAD